MTKLVLHDVSSHKPAEPIGDIIFVHGLKGHWDTTWTNGNDRTWFNWLPRDRPDLNVWSFEYDAPISMFGGNTGALYDKAIQLLQCATVTGLGHRPICFITHSLGGLIVKELIQAVHTDTVSGYQIFRGKICGVVFFSTPHRGAEIASLVKIVASQDVKDLIPGPQLQKLNAWYCKNAPTIHISTLSFFETMPTNGVQVVSRESGDPEIDGATAIPFPANHFDICKPQFDSELT